MTPDAARRSDTARSTELLHLLRRHSGTFGEMAASGGMRHWGGAPVAWHASGQVRYERGKRARGTSRFDRKQHCRGCVKPVPDTAGASPDASVLVPLLVRYVHPDDAKGLSEWEQAVPPGCQQRVVPDGSVDLIWTGDRLEIAGPDTHVRIVTFRSDSRLIGGRIRARAAGAVLGLPVAEWRDISANAGEVLGHDVTVGLLEQLASGEDPPALLLEPVSERGARARSNHRGDRPGAGAATCAGGGRRLGARGERAAVAAPHQNAVGDGPKTLQRVLRFQRLQTLEMAPPAQLALEAGYADQADMTVEVTALASVSPVRFLKDRTRLAA